LDLHSILVENLDRGFLVPAAVSYAGGVLTSFTPCLYPIIPILLTQVGAQSFGSRINGFLHSITFVLGLAVTYSALGIFASLTGKMFGEIQSSPWAYFAIANIILLFALSMLGLYEIRLPQFLQPKGRKKKGFLGTLLLGLASGFIAAPCTTPVLGVLLIYVSSKQHIVFGFLLLFFFAIGMGTLPIMLGTSTGLLVSLPKSGKWMVYIKRAMGWAMLVLVEYFLIQAGKFWL
jgi:cytochrome c-type biogenesis protein